VAAPVVVVNSFAGTTLLGSLPTVDVKKWTKVRLGGLSVVFWAMVIYAGFALEFA